MNLTVLTHTHTDCKDLWKIYFDSYNKYFKESKHIVILNEDSDEIGHDKIIYDVFKKFSDRILSSLYKIKTKYIILSFEDMFLYDYVKKTDLDSIIRIMDENQNIFYVRLIKSGVNSNIIYNNNLGILNNSDFLFSLTPTIWRVDKLIKVLESLKNLNIWELEVNGDLFLKSDSSLKLYVYNIDDKKRGSSHYDSSIYPHVCSAIFKGKWNFSEYKDILSPIIKKYNINLNERGFF